MFMDINKNQITEVSDSINHGSIKNTLKPVCILIKTISF
jgi:hypothetical protein